MSTHTYIAENHGVLQKQITKLQNLDAQYLDAVNDLKVFLDKPQAYYKEARPMIVTSIETAVYTIINSFKPKKKHFRLKHIPQSYEPWKEECLDLIDIVISNSELLVEENLRQSLVKTCQSFDYAEAAEIFEQPPQTTLNPSDKTKPAQIDLEAECNGIAPNNQISYVSSTASEGSLDSSSDHSSDFTSAPINKSPEINAFISDVSWNEKFHHLLLLAENDKLLRKGSSPMRNTHRCNSVGRNSTIPHPTSVAATPSPEILLSENSPLTPSILSEEFESYISPVIKPDLLPSIAEQQVESTSKETTGTPPSLEDKQQESYSDPILANFDEQIVAIPSLSLEVELEEEGEIKEDSSTFPAAGEVSDPFKSPHESFQDPEELLDNQRSSQVFFGDISESMAMVVEEAAFIKLLNDGTLSAELGLQFSSMGARSCLKKYQPHSKCVVTMEVDSKADFMQENAAILGVHFLICQNTTAGVEEINFHLDQLIIKGVERWIKHHPMENSICITLACHKDEDITFGQNESYRDISLHHMERITTWPPSGVVVGCINNEVIFPISPRLEQEQNRPFIDISSAVHYGSNSLKISHTEPLPGLTFAIRIHSPMPSQRLRIHFPSRF